MASTRDAAFAAPVTEDDFAAAIDALDHATVRQRVEHDGRLTERIQTIDAVTGEMIGERKATVDVDSKGGIVVEALVTGSDGRSEPNLAARLGTDDEVTAVDVIAVEGEEEPIEREDYLRT